MDETLDVLAAHGLAGATGIVFIGLAAQLAWNGVADGALYGDTAQLGHQVVAALATPAYAFAMTFVLLKVVGAFTSLRASAHDEALGMDVTQHGEEAYARDEGAVLLLPDDPAGRAPLAAPALSVAGGE